MPRSLPADRARMKIARSRRMIMVRGYLRKMQAAQQQVDVNRQRAEELGWDFERQELR
jgi:hypothetical protein